MSDVQLVKHRRYRLRGRGQKALLHFTKGGKRPPVKIRVGQWVEVLYVGAVQAASVLVNLQSPVVWVNLLDSNGAEFKETGYVSLSLFTAGRFVPEG